MTETTIYIQPPPLSQFFILENVGLPQPIGRFKFDLKQRFQGVAVL